MKTFKILSFVAGVLALTALASCAEKVEDPSITIEGENTVTLTKEKASFTVKVLSNRDWGMRFVGNTPDWIVAEPSTGKASKTPSEIKITVTENTGANRTASVEFYTGVATAMLTIVQAGPDGDSDGVEALTVQQFINKADKTTYYRLTGTVSRFNSEYCSFDLTDATGTIYVYSVAEASKAEWSSKIKNGGTVTIQGQYEFYSSKNQHEVVNAIIESFTGGEEQTEITASTVADFIAKASATLYYRLTGTVSEFKTGKNNSGKDWMQFNLTDNTGTILVYGFENGQFEAWSTKIKDNGTVTLVGTYEYYAQKSQHEVMNTRIESFTEGAPQEAVTGTVAETIAARDGAPVVIPEATVAAISKAGLVVADASGNVYIYFDSKANETVPAVTIGDKVKVEAVKSTYGGVPEFKTPTVTKLSAGSMTYPEPKDLNPVATSYASNTTEFVQMTGTLKIDGNYTNIEINGVDSNTKMGSVSQPTDDLNVSSFDGKTVTVKGYFTGLTGSNKFINVVATEIALADPNVKYFSVSPASLKAKADDTSASFSISSNADWTITCDNAAFTVSPASGSGDATVTVSFSANEGEEARVANIDVSCPEAGIGVIVVLTQAKPASGDALTIELDFTTEISGFPQASANGLQDGTYPLGGYDFIFHASEKFYQGKNSATNSLYILIGKANSYIQLPAIAGKSLVKVKFLTGAGASENVVVDVAKADGTRLNINNDKLFKGKEYDWDVPGEAGAAYRLLVTNAYNAQFQNLTLIYE